MPQDEAGSAPNNTHFWTEYKIPLALTFISILLIIFSIGLLIKSIQTTPPITFSTSSANQSGELEKNITVDVAGSVERPGVYKLSKDARVGEAIAAAGGLSGNADTDYVSGKINQAAVLTDGAKIYIPGIGENQTSHIITNTSDTSDSSGLSLISINSASQSELESLPGVGPVIAGKIIAGRPYGSFNELVAKKAMSQSLFNKLENLLSL